MKDEWKYEPAADLNLSAQERFQSTRREVGFVTTVFTTLRWLVCRQYLRLFHRFTFEGRENLPQQFPFVLVANHSSHLDTIALAAVLPAALNRTVFPIAAGDTFFETRKAAAFASVFLNALPIWRKRCGAHSLDDLKQRLAQGRCGYIIFPEGTRSRSGEMARFKPGIGMIVAGEEVPIVPCYLDGAHEAFPPDARIPRPKSVSLRIGKPLVFAEVQSGRAGWVKIAKELELAVKALS